MIPRIKSLTEKVLKGDMFFNTTYPDYDPEDVFLTHAARSAKRMCAYIMNQEPILDDDMAMIGHIRFDDERVEGEVFNRKGFQHCQGLVPLFYQKPLHNLFTFDWQHSVADYTLVLRYGIEGITARIRESRKHHTDPERLDFLDGMEQAMGAVIDWAEKCADRAEEKAKETKKTEVRIRMEEIARTLRKVPRKPAETFREAIQTIYFIYSFVPDSIGLIDRYLYPYYRADIDRGVLTRDEAGAYLQELFLMLQSKVKPTDYLFYRGGESHFCIGGYLQNGEDGFNELSRLILDSLMELPTWIPQISVRWTKKMPDDIFRYIMDLERKDANKRIAFVNDEPRIDALTRNAGLAYEDAVNYTMVGCNEVALPGGMCVGNGQSNILRSMANLFHNRGEELLKAKTFDYFYALYRQELYRDLDEILHYESMFSGERAKDLSMLSSPFFNGCIESAKGVNQGGAKTCIAQITLIGIPNVIDSLTVVKQFIYDQQSVPFGDLIRAVQNNWVGYEDLRTTIGKKASYFGNDSAVSNEMARRFSTSVYEYLKDKKDRFGYRFLVGNLIGYLQHNKWFGDETRATPDGRLDGEALSFGIGQSNGRDRDGLTALLNSIAQWDPNHIMCGPSVTNIMLDSKLVRDDSNFEKLVMMMKTYFVKGGLHYQLNYVSPEELRKAQKQPAAYKSLRVRVSGFSDFFNNLNDDLQEDVIHRTEHAV